MAEAEAHYTLPSPTFEKSVKVLIVVAPYYRTIADMLLEGARGALEAAGATHETVEVPGALEVPTAIRIAAQHSNFDGFVALGCVVRGETTHYDTVCNDSSRALQLLGLDNCCIGNGILTVETMDQAVVRADPKQGNKGAGAAEAALHLVALTRRFGRSERHMGFKPLRDEIQLAGDATSPTTA